MNFDLRVKLMIMSILGYKKNNIKLLFFTNIVKEIIKYELYALV